MYTFAILSGLIALAAAKESCPVTVRKPAECCPPVALHTSTSLINCHGCHHITTAPPIGVCDIICPTPIPTADITATVIKCSPSPTPAMVKMAKKEAEPQGPIKPCTTTSTVSEGISCNGCTVTSQKHTATHSVDCHGCGVLSITTTHPPQGPCPVCVGGVKTVAGTGTTTVTSCAASPTM